MTKPPTSNHEETLAEQLNAILDHYRENPIEADKSICKLLSIDLAEDGTLYAEDVFEATQKAGLRVQFKALEDNVDNVSGVSTTE